MNQYFFKITKEERENILDKHKTLYDGYVTEYSKGENKQPLYVQDFANDKNGITVSNKGNVKSYTNVNINEDIDRHDRISDGKNDLKNGTVDMDSMIDMNANSDIYHDDYPSPGYDDEVNFISLGQFYNDDIDTDDCDHCGNDFEIELGEGFDDYDIMDLRGGVDYTEKEFPKSNKYKIDLSDLNLGDTMEPKKDDGFDSVDIDFEEIDEDILPEFVEKLHESLDMFRRFKKYN
jgi:hypothetical protein